MSVERETRRSEYELRFLEKNLVSIYVYWSALLVLNGLFLTFFSLEALQPAAKTAPFLYLLVGASTVSVWLLVWNFRAVKEAFYRLEAFSGDGFTGLPGDVSETALTPTDVRRLTAPGAAEYRPDSFRGAGERLRLMRIREMVVEGLLVLETLLLLLVVIET